MLAVTASAACCLAAFRRRWPHTSPARSAEPAPTEVASGCRRHDQSGRRHSDAPNFRTARGDLAYRAGQRADLGALPGEEAGKRSRPAKARGQPSRCPALKGPTLHRTGITGRRGSRIPRQSVGIPIRRSRAAGRIRRRLTAVTMLTPSAPEGSFGTAKQLTVSLAAAPRCGHYVPHHRASLARRCRSVQLAGSAPESSRCLRYWPSRRA
jgi:hypothetical protein